MTTKLDLSVYRGDGRKKVFTVKNAKGKPENIFGWTGFKLTVNTLQNPPDDTTQVSQVTGQLKSNGLDGKIEFPTDMLLASGNFFYDIQALDQDSLPVTLAAGKYTVIQDITKD